MLEVKTCSKCRQEKPIDEFPWRSKAKGLRQYRCKTCYKEYAKQYYHNNPGEKAKQVARAIKNNKAGAAKFAAWKAEQNLKCACCDESAVECMDFHHIDPSTKDRSVSELVGNNVSWIRIIKEVNKCVVVCSNCHRKIHAGTLTLVLPH